MSSFFDAALRCYRVPEMMLGNSPEPKDDEEAARYRLVIYRMLGMEVPESDEAACEVVLNDLLDRLEADNPRIF